MLNIEKYKDEIKENGGIVEIYKKYSPKGQKICGYENFYDDCIDWLCEEYKEPILTDKEREYLKVVCEPFHERINCITKEDDSNGESINIVYDTEWESYLPSFKKGTMYKNMELYKAYTLKELGISYD